MQESKIISYNRDNFYLIKDSSLKKGGFIGKVKSLGLTDVTLSIYIFPEDTKDGRKEYMSEYEVFYTKKEMQYKFNGNEKQVKVVDLEEYIKIKYILNEKSDENKLFFRRQTYDEKKNSFYPYLQKICYCQKYFNPDELFKTCGCGEYFHPQCFMRNRSNICWNPKCGIDCSFFFDKSFMAEKNKLINSNQSHSPSKNNVIQETLEIFTSELESQPQRKEKNVNNSNEIITLEEFAEIKSPDNSKKNKRNDKIDRNAKIDEILNNEKFSGEKRIKQEPHVINLGKNDERPHNIIFDTTVYTRKNNQSVIKLETFSFEELKKKTETEREKARNLFFSKIMDGINMLQKDSKILDDYAKEKPELFPQITLIKTNDKKLLEDYYKELANGVEKNLFEYCDKKTNQKYLSFLREFSASMKNAISILYRLILGDITAEEISKFKPDDFLPEEKRKQKEELIRKTVQNMQFKEPMIIRATQVKGRMLSEIQDNIEINKPNYIMDMMLNLNSEGSMSTEYQEKIKNMRIAYPNMNENDIKFLVEAKEPSQDEIQKKLNSLIQKTLSLDERKELFDFRKNKLLKKADRYFKKKKDGKNGSEKINKNGSSLLGKKFLNAQDYIHYISLDIKPY